MTNLSPWWAPHRHKDRRPLLLLRGRIKTALRAWFNERHFTEIETSALGISPGNEAHLHAFATSRTLPSGQAVQLYLHTSPEFSAKKLLAAGEEKIFEFARVFRNREQGAVNVSEFTMLEWYRAHRNYDAVMSDCIALVRLAAQTAGTTSFLWRERECDPFVAPQKMTVAEAFTYHAGIELLPTLSKAGEGNRDQLATRARRAGFDVDDHDNWSDIFSKILTARIEPKLGLGAPLLLTEYPRCEAALAQASANDPRVSERFELYICGVELANGFGELTDPHEQRKRFTLEMDEKQRLYGERYPIDEELLDALESMPPTSGVALGFDRLVMLAAKAPSVSDVLWTPAL